jgi:hypothetical protein
MEDRQSQQFKLLIRPLLREELHFWQALDDLHALIEQLGL